MKPRTRTKSVCLNQGAWLSSVLVLSLFFVVQPPGVLAQEGARVKALNLADLVNYSAVIVRGHVLSVTAEKHPQLTNLNTVVVTLQVTEVLKGQVGSEYTFRQYARDVRDASSRLDYKIGAEMLLMLLPPSQYGLSSPVGFQQGRFRFQRDAQGNETIVNGRGNRGLMIGVEAALPQLDQKLSAAARVVVKQHREGPIGFTEFKDLIRGIIDARQ